MSTFKKIEEQVYKVCGLPCIKMRVVRPNLGKIGTTNITQFVVSLLSYIVFVYVIIHYLVIQEYYTEFSTISGISGSTSYYEFVLFLFVGVINGIFFIIRGFKTYQMLVDQTILNRGGPLTKKVGKCKREMYYFSVYFIFFCSIMSGVGLMGLVCVPSSPTDKLYNFAHFACAALFLIFGMGNSFFCLYGLGVYFYLVLVERKVDIKWAYTIVYGIIVICIVKLFLQFLFFIGFIVFFQLSEILYQGVTSYTANFVRASSILLEFICSFCVLIDYTLLCVVGMVNEIYKLRITDIGVDGAGDGKNIELEKTGKEDENTVKTEEPKVEGKDVKIDVITENEK